MTSILLVGAGAVAGRAARQLAETPGVDRVLVADRRRQAAEALAAIMDVEVSDWTPDHPVPDGVGAIAAAVPYDDDLEVARAALDARIAFASVADEHDAITALIGLDAAAHAAGVTVAGGCGLAPGLTDVLAAHAVGALDALDEVHVAREGVAGAASAGAVRRARNERPVEWRDGAWHDTRGAGPELVWFPDPIGARDCELAVGGIDLLVRAFPALTRATFRLSEPPHRRFAERLVHRASPEDSWGAARVEVHGARARSREAIVYGVVERTSVAAGTVLALTAAHLGGALSLGPTPPSGVRSLAELVDPVRFLAELSRRGVRAAAFEGVTVA